MEEKKGISYEVVIKYDIDAFDKLIAEYPGAHKYDKKILLRTTSGLPISQAPKTIANKIKSVVGDVDIQVKVLKTVLVETYNFRGENAN